MYMLRRPKDPALGISQKMMQWEKNEDDLDAPQLDWMPQGKSRDLCTNSDGSQQSQEIEMTRHHNYQIKYRQLFPPSVVLKTITFWVQRGVASRVTFSCSGPMAVKATYFGSSVCVSRVQEMEPSHEPGDQLLE